MRNSRTRIYHLSRVGPESGEPPGRWAARCGWTYGHFGGYVLAAPTPDTPVSERCDRCLGKPESMQRAIVQALA